MHQRLSACEAGDGCAEASEKVDPSKYCLHRHGWRDVIVFVAVSAGEIAPADGNDVSHDDVARGKQASYAGSDFAVPSGYSPQHLLNSLANTMKIFKKCVAVAAPFPKCDCAQVSLRSLADRGVADERTM